MSDNYRRRLSDPRWQKKRLKILERDGFVCQACKASNRELHVHHLRYFDGRKPWEYPDEELISLCHDCHERLHGSTKKRIYLAGKISKHGWRVSLFDSCSDGRISPPEEPPFILPGALVGGHDYCGPYFISCDHGCAHRADYHGCHVNDCSSSCQDFESLLKINPGLFEHAGEWTPGRSIAFANSVAGIKSCNLLFAWIESEDCHGTLAEIGLAFGLKKTIFVAFSKSIDCLWFARSMDSFGDHPDRFDTALDAFHYAMAFNLKPVV